jgi:hypothetical protein
MIPQILGSTDMAFVEGIVAQLANAGSNCDGPDFHMLNFAVSVINGAEPKNQLDTMLAAQMAAVHIAFMNYFRHLTVRPRIYDQDIAERAFNRLARTFASQWEAFQRYRTGGEKIVSQQVSVAAGGQAIVGNVMQAASETAPEKTAGASLRAALAGTNVVPMPVAKKAKQTSQGWLQTQTDQMTDTRNTGPTLASAPCGARTRSGRPRRSLAVHGKRRCRMHGGAPGSRAPHAATRTRLGMAVLCAKPLRNARKSGS